MNNFKINNIDDETQITDKFSMYKISPYFLYNFGSWMIIELAIGAFIIILSCLKNKLIKKIP